MGRKALSVRVRFEVFKRDRFTCQYCGKHPPEVLLEVDHIVPVAAGGDNTPANLRTACKPCNGGKGARLIEEGVMPAPSSEALDEMKERLEQSRAYVALVVAANDDLERQIQLVNLAWAKRFGATFIKDDAGGYWHFAGYHEYFPNEPSLARVLRRLPLETAFEAVDIAARKFPRANAEAERYFFGICWRRIKGDDAPRVPEATGGLRG